MKKVLLTGARGFIGRQTIPKLLEKGYEVHAIHSSNSIPFLPRGVFQHTCDLFNSAQIVQLMETVKPSHLLHFAWTTTPCKFWTALENVDWVRASLYLLQQFVLQGGKRVVVSGTCAEYDWSEGLCKEGVTPLIPSTLYGSCKVALHQILQAYAQQVGLSWAWGRVFFLYGPNEYSQRLVPYVVQSLLRQEIARCSSGTQIRDILYVEDVADAFVTLLDSEIQGAMNVGSGLSISLKEILDKIADKLEAIESVQYGAKEAAVTDAPKVVADTSRLVNELRWRPKYSLDQGLDQTIVWWKQEFDRKKISSYSIQG